jgi:hypothetical protein
MRGIWAPSLLLLVGCASQRTPPPPLPVPKAVPYPSEARTFTGAELERMRANFRLAGVAYGTSCWCMPSYVVHGDEPEGTNLRGYKCADTALTPEDSASCFGLDPHGIEQEGRYLCREWSLGPVLRDDTAAGKPKL